MYSTRGVKFKFSDGERVLCYEPDPTKAKVLYESKVLDLVVSRDGRGRKVPEYLIHFFGWNSSWDRCVREEFILPYTEENRQLQTKLAKDAALAMKGKRKSKLPPLIKETLSKELNSESESQDVKPPQVSPQSSSESESSEEEIGRNVTLHISDILKLVLEEDWRLVAQRDKFVKLPCEPNVITILEGYVKYVAANLLCASPPKNVKNGRHLMPNDVKNKLNLCKEAMDGIRVYFDFTLPHLLLYNSEKSQYYTIGTVCAPIREARSDQFKIEQKPLVKMECESIHSIPEAVSAVDKGMLIPKPDPEPLQNRPQRGRQSLRSQPEKNIVVPKVETTANGHPETKPLARLQPDKLPPDKPVKKTTRGRPKGSCSRVLRSSDKQKQPVAKEESSSNISPPQAEVESTVLLQPKLEPLSETSSPPRVTRKAVQNSSPPPQVSSPSIPSQSPRSVTGEKTMPNCSTTGQPNNQAPPSLSLASDGISSSNSSTHSTMSSPVTEGQQYHLINNSGLLQEILSWQMLPDYIYAQRPPEPSLIYGAQHLLRLFVKLPDLMSKMNMSRRKRESLIKILENFLLYLAEKKDELFLPSAYINATLPPPPPVS